MKDPINIFNLHGHGKIEQVRRAMENHYSVADVSANPETKVIEMRVVAIGLQKNDDLYLMENYMKRVCDAHELKVNVYYYEYSSKYKWGAINATFYNL